MRRDISRLSGRKGKRKKLQVKLNILKSGCCQHGVQRQSGMRQQREKKERGTERKEEKNK